MRTGAARLRGRTDALGYHLPTAWASVMPAMSADFGSGLRQVVVPGERTAGYDFSGLVRRKNATCFVHDDEANRRRRPAATAQAFRMISGGRRSDGVRIEKSEEHGRFCLAIRLAMHGPKTSTPSLSLSGETGEPASRKTCRLAVIELTHVGVIEQCIERRRWQRWVARYCSIASNTWSASNPGKTTLPDAAP